jgi:hypothetical protein
LEDAGRRKDDGVVIAIAFTVVSCGGDKVTSNPMAHFSSSIPTMLVAASLLKAEFVSRPGAAVEDERIMIAEAVSAGAATSFALSATSVVGVEIAELEVLAVKEGGSSFNRELEPTADARAESR